MTMPTTATGEWHYDPADPGVGIFTGEWVHEGCALDEPATTEEVTNVERLPLPGGGTRIVTHYRMTCTCGATFEAADEDYDPGEEG